MLCPGKMIYRCLGNSGLKVSAISLGNMINYQPQNYEQDRDIIAAALKGGINSFDTAERYASGQAQLQLGKALKQLQTPRQEVVISTKIHTAPQPDINSSVSTNRKHIRESIGKSLDRLQTDHVDLLYAHLHDDGTPLQEICRSFHQVIEEGQAFYWATSNWEPEVVFEALSICQRLNLHKPIAGQNQYNMLVRKDQEIQFKSLYEKYNFGLVGWSTLAGGFLTGKYLDGIPSGQVNRMTDSSLYFPMELLKGLYYDPWTQEETINKLRSLGTLSASMGFKLSHLAIAWAIRYRHLDSALIGARTVTQLEDCLKAIDFLENFSDDFEGEVNKILGTTPEPRTNYLDWSTYPPVRPEAK